MKEKLMLLTLIIGLVLYVFDFVSDCYVCLQHAINRDIWWFLLTFSFIAIPSILVNLRAINNLKRHEIDKKIVQFAIFTNSGMLVRYVQELRQWKKINFDSTPCGTPNQSCSCSQCPEWYRSQKKKSAERGYSMEKLRYIETITESAPQWCLQTYIMLRFWYFPWYTVLSVIFSILSLTWSVTALEKARSMKENRNFRKMTATTLFIGQLAFLISRLSSIVLFAYVFRYYVVVFLAANWLFLAVVVSTVGKRNFYSHPDNPCMIFFTVFFLCYPLVFHYSETCISYFDVTIRKRVATIVCFSLVLGNIVMITLSVTCASTNVLYMDLLKHICVPFVATGLLVAGVLFIVYYTCFFPDTNYDDQINNTMSRVNIAFEDSSV